MSFATGIPSLLGVIILNILPTKEDEIKDDDVPVTIQDNSQQKSTFSTVKRLGFDYAIGICMAVFLATTGFIELFTSVSAFGFAIGIYVILIQTLWLMFGIHPIVWRSSNSSSSKPYLPASIINTHKRKTLDQITDIVFGHCTIQSKEQLRRQGFNCT